MGLIFTFQNLIKISRFHTVYRLISPYLPLIVHLWLDISNTLPSNEIIVIKNLSFSLKLDALLGIIVISNNLNHISSIILHSLEFLNGFEVKPLAVNFHTDNSGSFKGKHNAPFIFIT